MDHGTLIYARKGGAIQRLTLTAGTSVIGSDQASDLVLDDGAVSPKHARIMCDEGGCWITDAGSANGSFLNRARLQPHIRHPVRDGDVVQIGPFFLRYAQAQPPASTSEQRTNGHTASAKHISSMLPPDVAARLPLPTAPAIAPTLIAEPGRRFAGARRLNGNQGAFQAVTLRPTEDISSYMHYLPAPYQESEFLNRFLLLFESIINPVEQVIEHMHAYFDPRLAPEGMLPWLATWVDVVLDEHLSMRQQRELIASAAMLYQWRGTAHGLREYIRICTDIEPTIVEPNSDAGAELPPYVFGVVLDADDPAQIDRALIERIVEAHKPAHTAYVLEIRAVAM